MNAPVLEFIVAMGADSASLSDAAVAWLKIQQHFESLVSTDLSRLSSTPGVDIALLQAHAVKRFGDGMKDVLCLALLLDCRPKTRAFVKQQGIVGTGSTLGATDTVEAAKRAIMQISEGIRVQGKTSHEVGLALCNGLLMFLEVRAISNATWLLDIIFCYATANHLCGMCIAAVLF